MARSTAPCRGTGVPSPGCFSFARDSTVVLLPYSWDPVDKRMECESDPSSAHELCSDTVVIDLVSDPFLVDRP
jgi:hypothetical protein